MKDKAGHTRFSFETDSSNLIHDEEWMIVFFCFSLFVFKSCKGGSSRDAILAHFFHAEHDNDRAALAKYSIAYNL